MSKQSERAEFISKLRETLKPGDKLHTVLRSVSRSGMSRVIDVYKLGCSNQGTIEKSWLSYWVAKAADFTFDQKADAIKVSGCGMDMGFHVVYNLGRTLWPDGFICSGENCHSNDHTNGDRDYTPHIHADGGYALTQEWL